MCFRTKCESANSLYSKTGIQGRVGNGYNFCDLLSNFSAISSYYTSQSSPVTTHFFTKYCNKLRLGFAISTTVVWFNVLIGNVSFAISKTSTH